MIKYLDLVIKFNICIQLFLSFNCIAKEGYIEKVKQNPLLVDAQNKFNELDYRGSMIVFIHAIQESKIKNDQLSELIAYRGIGKILMDLKDYDKADVYFNKCLVLAKKIHNTNEIKHVQNDIALLYTLKKQYHRAHNIFSDLLRNAILEKDTVGISMMNLNLGLVNLNEKKYIQALQYYFTSLKYSKILNNQETLCLLYSHIAYSNCMINQAKLALCYLDTGNIIAQKSQNKSVLFNNLSLYAMIYDSLQMNDSAIKYYREVMKINDTLNNNQETALISQIIQESIEEEMKKEIELLQQEKEITNLRYQRLIIIFTATGVLLVLLTVFIFLYFRQIKLKKEKQTLVLEKQILRLQMNPHFISNSLVAIQSFVFAGEKNYACKYIADFSKLMRIILYKSRSEYITLKEEIEILEYYLTLQKLRFESSFSYEIVTELSADPEQIQIPPMLTQPFIENAIEHGLAMLKIQGNLIIRFKQQSNSILYEVLDNGIGREASKKIAGKTNKISQSISITESRLKLLNKGKKGKITIEIIDLYDNKGGASGTKVSFVIPVNTIFQKQN
ncbi:MAG: hypothetical protein A2W91_08630 [Bacteroidetes bacterium GWF2_38_335]|nr:MAG: hypothetical protein A2W91_08630 [Bacteroidetes bacterium GWF2_38_335]OFY80443.1 MAG: hypothetical protein A2281_08355 [Bacteroidetes bacterium RIFOXYA12_FULL_38_20]HBS85956.1 hypothetical protein [Bacteroidales bacterium]